MERELPLALCLLVIGFSSCAKKPTPQAPLQPVTLAVAAAESVPLTISTFGNVVTIAAVTLQAQVNGILRYAVVEGAMVKKGDLIAEIDPVPFQAALQEAQGNWIRQRRNSPTRRSPCSASRSSTRPRRSISPIFKPPKPTNCRPKAPSKPPRVSSPMPR